MTHDMLILGLELAGVALGYILMGTFMFALLTEVFSWRDEETALLCSVGWPIMVAFWGLLGGPVLAVMWLVKKLLKALRGATKLTRRAKISSSVIVK